MHRTTASLWFTLIATTGFLSSAVPCCAQGNYIPPLEYSPPHETASVAQHSQAPNDLHLPHAQRQELANAAAHLLAAARLLMRGEDTKAVEQADRSFQIRKNILGLEHSETLQAVALLENLYVRGGNFSEGKAMFQLAFDNSKKLVGLEHHVTATYMTKLAEAKQELGEVAEAETLFREALRVKQKLLGREHWETVHTMHALGNCLSAQFRPDGNQSQDEAMDLLFRSLEIGQRIHWPISGMVAKIQTSIGMAYSTNKQYAKAEPFLRSSVEHMRNTPQSRDPDLSTSLNNLGACLYYQQKFDEAEAAYLEALPLAENKFGIDHPATAHSINNLAVLRDEQERYSEAVPLFQRQHSIFKNLLGADHPKLKESQKNLDNAIRKLEESKQKQRAANGETKP
jgi:tetratricopeptide (TPR) repeat protein